MANGCMRTLRAIYNHARKTNRSLPSDNSADAVDWNVEERRDTGMGSADLKGWLAQLASLDNPVRREFHLSPVRFSACCASGSQAGTHRFSAPRATYSQTKGRKEESLRHSVVASDDPLPHPRNPVR